MLLAMAFPGSVILTRRVQEGTARIAAGGFYQFSYNNGESPWSEIGYEFVVGSGGPVDVYLLTPSDHERYLAGQPLLGDPFWSEEGVMAARGSPYPPAGENWVVIDNSDYGATPSPGRESVVRYRVDAGGPPVSLVYTLAGLGFGSILAGILIASKQAAPREPGGTSKGE